MSRFWRELGTRSGEHDLIVRIIIVERILKAVLLILGAIVLVILGREGVLAHWAADAQYELNWEAGSNVFSRLLDQLLVRIGLFRHLTAVAIGIAAYALLEGSEGIGLALRRRWAEYLTVLATGFLIPYELFEVVRKPTLLRAGALLVNVAIVVYLAYRKRLFMDL